MRDAMLARMTESNLNGQTWHAPDALATGVRDEIGRWQGEGASLGCGRVTHSCGRIRTKRDLCDLIEQRVQRGS